MTIKDAKTRLIVLACMCEGKDFYDKVDAEALKLAIKNLDILKKVRREFGLQISPNVDSETGEPCDNWVVDMENSIWTAAIKIIDKYLSEVGND